MAGIRSLLRPLGIVGHDAIEPARCARHRGAAAARERPRRGEDAAPAAPGRGARLRIPPLQRGVQRTLPARPARTAGPRLQRLGNRYDEFLYSIAWGEDVAYRDVRAYQRGATSSFDNRIMLRLRVGEHLVILNGLLRPLIHREWAALVARMNRLEEARLEAFLFGPRRIVLRPVVDGLRELQEDRCFYCEERLVAREGRRPDVDHFIPWSRYPNDAIQNLVVAHQRCNIHKSDFLAAADHVSHWIERLDRSGEDLARIASSVGWETDRDRTLGVARGVYGRLPEDMPLWVLRREFAADLPRVRPLLE